ncbi:MAG: hypothetical protein GKR89_03890 [Candidatus Latescibacteria bacterium]|nr:hypothetical protein [Candidatus Latescibacterota bacterium]
MNSAHYDALVIGSGFGGSMVASRLSRAGHKTLLLERGDWARRDAQDWDQRRILVEQRYQGSTPLQVRQYGARDFADLSVNETVGGQSVFYGGASLRLRETDFAAWPLNYEDLEPFYAQAEMELGVHGEAGADGCEPWRSSAYPFPSAALTPPAERIYRAGVKAGLQPFKIPLAINFRDKDRPVCIRCITCDGFPCKIEAKNDLASTVLARAQGDGLEIMPGVVVQRLVEEGGRIVRVECLDWRQRRVFSVTADVVVVSGGAVQSPALLLRSGLGQGAGSEFMGRYLMRHCNAVVSSVFPFRTNPKQVFHKQLCFTDSYEDWRQRAGTAVGVIQDIYTPAPAVIRHFSPWGLKMASGLMAPFMQNLLCIAEDEPSPENAVELGHQEDQYGLPRVQVRHEYSRADYQRRDHLVRQAKRVLRRAGGLLSHVYPINSFSHAVGSLRFGRSPAEGALDMQCRLWDVDNLYVVDGSFMPTSGGVNPSLTIAANALRVAEHIAGGGR